MPDAPNPFCTTLPTQLRAWDSTALRAFMECPRKYLYSIVGGWRLPPGAHVEWGRRYHEAVEIYDRCRCDGLSKADATVEAFTHALIESWDFDTNSPWETGDTKKNRHTLLRAVVWYCDEQREEGGVQPFRFPDGRAGVEISFQLPLPLTSPDGTPYLLTGHIDSVATDDGGATAFPRERKTTQSSLGPFYFDQYDPDVQIDTYDLAFSVLFPDLGSHEVLLEATQTAVGFARFHRHSLHRTEGQREEHLALVQDTIKRAEVEASRYAAGDPMAYPMNKSACYARGGCPFRNVCNKDQSVRERYLKANYEIKFWNTLATR